MTPQRNHCLPSRAWQGFHASFMPRFWTIKEAARGSSMMPSTRRSLHWPRQVLSWAFVQNLYIISRCIVLDWRRTVLVYHLHKNEKKLGGTPIDLCEYYSRLIVRVLRQIKRTIHHGWHPNCYYIHVHWTRGRPRKRVDIALAAPPSGIQYVEQRSVTILSMSWSFICWMCGSVVVAGNSHERNLQLRNH